MKELLKYIGREAYLRVDTLKVVVTILDVKMSYGKIRFQVTPKNGCGLLYVEQERLELK